MQKKFKRPTLPPKGPNAVWVLLCLLGLGVAYLVWYNSINRDVERVSGSMFVRIMLGVVVAHDLNFSLLNFKALGSFDYF